MTDNKRFDHEPDFPEERKPAAPEQAKIFEGDKTGLLEKEKEEQRIEDERRAEEIADRLKQPVPATSSASSDRYLELCYGEFAGEPRDESGRIILDGKNAEAVERGVADLKSHAPMLPRLASGVPIAAEYRIRVGNYSTKTRIVDLPDGRKVFAVHAYVASSIHRTLDHVMKWASGLKMHKVPRSQWKKAFEAKSNIPVIAHGDPNVVLLPYLKNVNAYDVFANNHEMAAEDFGDMSWAAEVGIKEKLALADAMVDELRRAHHQGKVWGEVILPNIILTAKEQKPVICDPEIVYDDDVSREEAKARDLKDLIHSVCGALARSECLKDLEGVVKRLMDRYQDTDVLDRLKTLSAKRRTLLQKLTFAYEKVRSGATDEAEYIRVLKAMAGYELM